MLNGDVSLFLKGLGAVWNSLEIVFYVSGFKGDFGLCFFKVTSC